MDLDPIIEPAHAAVRRSWQCPTLDPSQIRRLRASRALIGGSHIPKLSESTAKRDDALSSEMIAIGSAEWRRSSLTSRNLREQHALG